MSPHQLERPLHSEDDSSHERREALSECSDRKESFLLTGMCVRDNYIPAALQSAAIQRCYVTLSEVALWFENTSHMSPRTQVTSPGTGGA